MLYLIMCSKTHIYIYNQRKFRSQTSGNMDRWKSRGGKSQRREEKKKEDQRTERVRGKKMQVHEKAEKSQKTVFLKWFVAPEGRQVGSLKRRARSHLARWEMKNCTPLWREAHFKANTYKTHHSRSTFGSWEDEKMHAVVARSTFRSQKCKKLTVSDHFWKLRWWKSARRCGAKHISKSKCTKHLCRTAFGSWHFEKSACRCGATRSTFPSQNAKKHRMLGPLSKVQMWFCMAGARDSAPCQKWAKREGFVAFSKTMAGIGHLKKICKDACRVAGAVQETCSSEMLGGQGADFLRGVAFWSIRSSGLLRWFCVTGAALRMTWHHFFVAGAALYTDGVEKSQKACIGTMPSALHSTFYFCRKSRRIASLLMLSTSKIEDVSQNSFVFDVVKFKNWGVSQNCCASDVVKFKNWGSLAE